MAAAKSCSVATKLTDAEREMLDAAALASGQTVSDFVRAAVLAAISDGVGVSGALRNIAEQVRTLAGTFDAAVRLSLDSPDGATLADWDRALAKLSQGERRQ